MGGSSKQGPTADERALAEVAVKEWQRYQQKYVPAEDKAIKQALDVESGRRRALGETSADFYQRFGETEPAVLAAQASRGGATPGSGAFDANLTGSKRDRSVALGAGLSGAGQAIESQRLFNAQNLVSLGQGEGDRALAGLGEVAEASQRQAFLDARASAASRAATQQLVGTGLGIAGGFYADKAGSGLQPTGYGDLKTQGYQDQGLTLGTPVPVGG